MRRGVYFEVFGFEKFCSKRMVSFRFGLGDLRFFIAGMRRLVLVSVMLLGGFVKVK